MSIVYLTPDDFYITNDNEFVHRLPNFSLVFFSSIKCEYCKDVLPAFVSMSSMIKGCTFAMMDVDQMNKRVVRMSADTKLPITYVPFVVMYVNGTPIGVFNPDENNPSRNLDLLKDFIVDNANSIKNRKSSEMTGSYLGHHKVCDTSIGMALCGKKVCYLRDCEAYSTNKEKLR